MRNARKHFVISGPEDHNQLPQYWTVDWEWGDFSRAEWYGEELLALPVGELPIGTAFIMDMDNYTLSHTGGV